jgi:hypothetical protein
LIGDPQWWMTSGLRIWETIVQKLGCKTKTILLEIEREIKSEFVRFFKIRFGKSVKIKTEYKLWFLGRSVFLENTFLKISDNK